MLLLLRRFVRVLVVIVVVYLIWISCFYRNLFSTLLGGIKTECLKTIIVDDPLPPKTITPREMNVMYYQREVCQILSERSYEYKGVPSSRHSFKESVQQKNVFLGSVDFNDRLMADENQPNNSETDNRFLNCHLHVAQHSELETNSVDANYGGDERNTNTKKKQHLKNNDSHFSYSIWTFGNYKLLIRALDHGVLYQSNKGGKGSLHPVNVYVKPEYQLMFGHEQITPSEASKWWMNSYINRNSLCICARVDPVSSELLKIDVLSQAAIIKLTSFNPAQPMKMIHNVLARLEKLLKPGRFILSHSPGDMHICIYELVNEKKDGYSYDLHEAYSHNRDVLVNYDKDVPWVSVDPNMFLEWHIAHDRIPMTFPAVSSEELTKAKEAKLSTGNKKKGKKKKKKKFNAKKTKELSADGKAYENNKLFNTKEHKRLRSRDELSHDLPVAAVKARNNDAPTDTGISERFQSRTVPVTYHDMEFNF